MRYYKIIIVFIFLFYFGAQSVIADVSMTIEINNVNVNGGKIYGYVFYSEAAYKNKKADKTFQFNPINSVISHEINLSEGECMISIFQDNNGNGKLDMGFFNIPKEPVGMTNYNGGIPGNFNKLRINIAHNGAKIIIPLIIF